MGPPILYRWLSSGWANYSLSIGGANYASRKQLQMLICYACFSKMDIIFDLEVRLI